MNAYGYYNYKNSPKGWDHFDGLMDPYTYIYNTPVFSANGERPRFYQGQHQTDVLRAKSVAHLKTLLANPDQPWFLEVAGVAPHQQFNGSGMWPPVAATRHRDLFPDLKAPRTPNFNPPDELHNKPAWVGDLPRMDEATIAFSDDTYRRRAQSIVGLNEMFHELLDVLEEAGELENTYIITSSDHGYHVGQHRVAAGKLLPYKEDTNVPFIIRGPGIPKGQSSKLPSSHVDIAPTLLTLVGLPEERWPVFLDGRDLSTYWSGAAEKLNPAPETVNIEYWGGSFVEMTNNLRLDPRNTYKTVRIVGVNYAYLYSHWCTNETELYDSIADPYELTQIPYAANPRLHGRLNGLLLTTKGCSQDSCRNPWAALHPDGSVANLAEALEERHNVFYEGLPKVAFKECLNYLLVENEAPFYPAQVEFGTQWRDKAATDGLFRGSGGGVKVQEVGHFGDAYQPLEVIEKTARDLTDEELGYAGKLGYIEEQDLFTERLREL